jgi:hypothetical protein
MAMNGYARSPTRYSTSPTSAVSSSPSAASVAICDVDSVGMAGTAIDRE